MADNHADFVVLGAGPGGYACAFRAADLGRKVVLPDQFELVSGETVSLSLSRAETAPLIQSGGTVQLES